ncbi:MAG: rhodanese-like domain-containing protein [Acidimicrobiia bacterium]|nr:rhodanese-like domain-containing protein [Acidimicrobiia bacterium]
MTAPTTPPSATTGRSVNPVAIIASIVVFVVSSAVLLVACGGSTDTASPADGGIRVVSPGAAAEMLEQQTDELVVIDVRTPEEFAEGHLDGAIQIDFYSEDFTDSLAKLDRDRPYVIYCRSGSRSGQTREIMADLGFIDVADIEGGIVAWEGSGLSTTN